MHRWLVGFGALVVISSVIVAWWASSALAADPDHASDIASGGLGLTHDTWDEHYGPSTSVHPSSASYRVAMDDAAQVSFTSPAGRQPRLVRTIEIHLPWVLLTDDEVQSLAHSLLPSDVVYVGRSRQRIHGRTIVTDRFTSESLRQAFPAACKLGPRSSLRPGDVLVAQTLESTPQRPVERPVDVSVYWHCPAY